MLFSLCAGAMIYGGLNYVRKPQWNSLTLGLNLHNSLLHNYQYAVSHILQVQDIAQGKVSDLGFNWIKILSLG